MAVTIQLRSGLQANVAAATVSNGEPLWTTDTHQLYVCQGGAKYLINGLVSPLTTKGDVWIFSSADARLGVGADGTVLTARSSEAEGLAWESIDTGNPSRIWMGM